MNITIDGTPKEIADLVLEIQKSEKPTEKPTEIIASLDDKILFDVFTDFLEKK